MNITSEPNQETTISKNKPKNNHLNYYKGILISCYSDIAFQSMVNSIGIQGVVHLPKNIGMFRFILKCYNNSTNVIVGAVDENLNLTFSILASLSIVMSHYHLSKNNFIQDNFFYKIMGDEKGAILQFIKRVRLIDERIKYLISNYINNIDENSPIAELISKNKVTYNQNWIYTGIINKGKDHEYINCRYFKDPINKKFKIGTNVYSDEKYCREVADLLSRDTFCYIRGNIYPIVKVSYVIVNERTINGVPMVNFTCKAYFVDINFSSDSIYTSTERI